MKVMIKFEMEVLNQMNYALLTNMEDKLSYSLETSKKLRKEYVDGGAIGRASNAEVSIVRIEENLSMVRLAMSSKEHGVMETFQVGNEPICKN